MNAILWILIALFVGCKVYGWVKHEKEAKEALDKAFARHSQDKDVP